MKRFVACTLALVGCSGNPRPTVPVVPAPVVAEKKETCPDRLAGARVPNDAETRTIPNANVAALCIIGVGADAKRTAGAIIGVKEHAPLALSQVMRDTHALMENGAFDDVTVAALPREGGLVVVYDLRERKRLAELVIEGADEDAKKTVTLKRGAPMPPWEIGRASAALREAYAARGRHGAKVTPSVEPMPEGVRVRLVVTPGPVWKFGALNVSGATKIPATKLVEAAALPAGKPFDETEMNHAAALVELAYMERGYLHARVRAERVEPGTDGVVPVDVRVEHEGDAYKVAKISLDKLDPDVARVVRGKLVTKPNAIAELNRLRQDEETIEKAYAARGKKVEVWFATPFDEAKKTVDVVFELRL